MHAIYSHDVVREKKRRKGKEQLEEEEEEEEIQNENEDEDEDEVVEYVEKIKRGRMKEYKVEGVPLQQRPRYTYNF